MEELSRKGHRERVRKSYMNNSFDSLHDHNILEHLLFYAIPQKDTKPLAYKLINHFGTFENVINADISELMKVDGVGEYTAVLIDLIKNINLRMADNESKKTLKLDNNKVTKEYIKSRLERFNTERILIISLDNNLKFINEHIIGSGTAGFASVETREVLECMFRDNASSIIVAHNHPHGSAEPSLEDLEFTRELTITCRKVHVNLLNHYIAGENGVYSMADDMKVAGYFDLDK